MADQLDMFAAPPAPAPARTTVPRPRAECPYCGRVVSLQSPRATEPGEVRTDLRYHRCPHGDGCGSDRCAACKACTVAAAHDECGAAVAHDAMPVKGSHEEKGSPRATLSAPARDDAARAIARGLLILADALQCGDVPMRLHEAGTHCRCAAEMVRAGKVGEAACYLRTLARTASIHRRTIRRSPYAATFCNVQLAGSLAAVVVAYSLALRWTLRLGVPSRFWTRWPVTATAPQLVDFGDTREDGSARHVIAGYSREVANRHWPALTSHGVYVEVRRVQRDGFWIELQALAPDLGRSQFVVTRRSQDRAEALRIAQALAELGEAVIAAAGEVRT